MSAPSRANKRGDRAADAAVGAGDQRDLVLRAGRSRDSAAASRAWARACFRGPGSRSSWIIGSMTSDMTAYSLGATPMPSRSNSAAVAWLSDSLGPAVFAGLSRRRFGFGLLPATLTLPPSVQTDAP